MDIKDLKNLAELSRIDMKESEMESLGKDFDSILEYIAQIKKVATDSGEEKAAVGALHNVMRDDEKPHESGLYTEDIVKNMPESEKGYLRVKKIL